MTKADLDDLAVYIHWPYCSRICPYCDFNVYKDRQDSDLVQAICADLSYWRSWGGPRRVSSVHFGGGTPSLLDPQQITEILNQIFALWDVNEDCEIAIEANPNDANEARWVGYRAAGMTRLSLGVQSFDDAGLKLLGRDHNAAQAKAALRLASDTFPKVSADLIYGWSGQDASMLRYDLESLLAYNLGHISAYQLTIEDGTAFAKAQSRGDIKAQDADISAEFYDIVRDVLTQAGFAHYEVSNFARKHHRSHHNLAYWQGRDYVGVGPGAHGRMTFGNKRYAAISAMRPDDYSAHIGEHKNGIETLSELTPSAHGEEYVIMGLRIEDGISLSRYKQITGENLPQHVIDILIGDDLLVQKNDRLSASPAGRVVLNTVTDMLLITD